MKKALAIKDRVDRIERLHQDPPVRDWDEMTAWGMDHIDGDLVLVETAVIKCPSCDEDAFWARGRVACPDCETKQRLVG